MVSGGKWYLVFGGKWNSPKIRTALDSNFMYEW